MSPRILAMAGSTRVGSLNKKLVRLAADGAREAGAEVTTVDLRDLPLPLYDADLEEADGLPPNARELKDIFFAHQGLILACPEYNSSITAVLKNAIDWISRPVPGEAPLQAFRGKVAGLVSASPGALGGLRGLVHVRAILGNLGVIVLPDQVAVMKADQAFADDGSLRDEKVQASVRRVGATVASTAARLVG